MAGNQPYSTARNTTFSGSSFSPISTNFDFVMTIAMGSLLASASQSSQWTSFLQSLVAMAALFLMQYIVAKMRQRLPRFDEVVQNSPALLTRDGIIFQDALRATRVSEDDLTAKLREANALDLSRVRAVVLETTGDVSVLHGDRMDEKLLQGIGRT
ncbi:DUF421 domain-containing protein [Roseovarius sp. Pro17]|uniref:DUF421 domain-containing protein n=1 Tax=Roseovarius sp. Pro17 TaxID=3108175 RepID=UPI002D772139|nr:YetF domain-containing protein [Roseovarius sp. Pro17]